jgi:hypothetical protein
MKKVDRKQKTCFVISALGDDDSPERKRADRVFEIIRHAAEGKGYKVSRGHTNATPGLITRQAISRLIGDPLVIADLSGHDPTVYYELAIRHASHLPFIQIINKGEQSKLPIYAKDVGTVEIDPNETFEAVRSIEESLNAVSEPNYEVQSPIESALIEKAFEKYANAKEKSIATFLDDAITKINVSLAKLQELTVQIEDATRKPLHGIEQVLVEAYDLLHNKAQVGGGLWFVGMTLGLGPPHRHRRVLPRAAPSVRELEAAIESLDGSLSIDEVFQRRWPNREELRIEKVIDVMHERLGQLLEHAPNPVVVCLPQDVDALRDRFLVKLARRRNYATLKGTDTDHPLITELAEEIYELHRTVQDRKPDRVRTLDSIPLQMLIVELKPELGHNKKACLVFHVGTDNIGTTQQENGESGFYTEVDNIVDVFQTMADSLFEAATEAPSMEPLKNRRLSLQS